MKVLRISVPLLAFTACAVLAACGGGGGGGGTTNPPTTNPGPSNPPATNAPATNPPATNPPATNPPATNPPATNPPSTPPPGATPPPVNTSSTIFASETAQNGHDGDFNPVDGDTSSGGQTQTVDGVPCGLHAEPVGNQYHVHAYLGLFVNGRMEAIPDAIGLPGFSDPDTPGQPDKTLVSSYTCAYLLHTHDESGIIHVEDPAVVQQNPPQSLFTLQQFFDIWGITVNSSQFGSFSGPVTVFTGTPHAGGPVINGDPVANSYTSFNGTAGQVPLNSHVAIWVVVGAMPAGGLPQVAFGTQY